MKTIAVQSTVRLLYVTNDMHERIQRLERELDEAESLWLDSQTHVDLRRNTELVRIRREKLQAALQQADDYEHKRRDVQAKKLEPLGETSAAALAFSAAAALEMLERRCKVLPGPVVADIQPAMALLRDALRRAGA